MFNAVAPKAQFPSTVAGLGLMIAILVLPTPTDGALPPGSPHQNTPMARGIAAVREGDTGTAITALEQATTLAPNSVEAHFWLGVARLQAGLPAAAEEALLRADELMGRFDPRISEQLGIALMRLGDLEGARERFEAIAEADPSNPVPRLNLGWILMREDRGVAALAIFESISAEHPANAAAYYYAGRIHDGNARFAAAEVAYRHALEIEPDMLQAQLALGNLETSTGDLSAARTVLEKAAHDHPEAASTHVQLGLLDLREDRLEAATRAFGRAISLEPENATAHYNLGLALARSGDHVASREAFNRFEGLRIAAGESEREGRREHAESRAEALIRGARQSIDAADWDAARNALEESLALEGGRPDAMTLLAAVHRQLARDALAESEAERAVFSLQRAAELEPGSIETWELLVEAYRAAGDEASREEAMARLRALRGAGPVPFEDE